MKKFYIRNQTDKFKLITFLFAFLPKAILCFFVYPVCVFSDEVATIAGGAFFAGLDWSEVISHAGYYGSGMTAWMAPLFRMTDNPVIIYRGILIFCTLLQAITAVVAYSLLTEMFKVDSPKWASVIGVICSYLVFSRTTVVFNEHGLLLVTWGIAWILARLHGTVCSRKKKEKALYTALLMLVCSYAMTLHMRASTYWIALAVTVLLYAWIYKRCLVSVPTVLAVGGMGYVLSGCFVDFIKSKIWLLEAGEAIRNGQVSLGGGWRALLNPHNWKAWLNIIVGQVHTLSVVTGGLCILFLIVFACVLWERLVKRGKYVLGEENRTEEYAVLLILFFGAAAAMTILAQSLSWLGGSMEAVDIGYGNNVYGTKAYGYLRYFGVYCGPLFLVGLVYLYQKREWILKYFNAAFVVLILVEIYWQRFIVPYIVPSEQIGAAEYYCPFSLNDLSEGITWESVFPASVILFVLFIAAWISLKHNKTWIPIVLSGAVLVHVYFFIGIVLERNWANEYYDIYGNVYEIIKGAEKEGELPRMIYAENAWEITNHEYFYEYQMLLNRYQIIPDRPPEDCEEAIAFTNGVYEEEGYREWTKAGYEYAVVNEYIVMFVKGEELQKAFEASGVMLSQ